jgi:carboxylate-amine ligase
MTLVVDTTPAWAEWKGTEHPPYTVGVEEEVMLVEPHGWSLAHRIDSLLPTLPREFAAHVMAETHGSAVELATGVHRDIPGAARELGELRAKLTKALERLDMRGASAGTHAFATWHDTVISSGTRYQLVYGSMRELARREPTFALHVHVGIETPEAAIRALNRLRAHLPLLLALSANSPFWQGRDTGLASARTPLFQAFPRVGVPRRFADYCDYVEAVDVLIRCDAFPEPSFLWWDVRPQARFGTVEVRIMDAQASVQESAALAALVQSLARLEVEEGFVSETMVDAPEVIDENRFVAARDGMKAEFINPESERRVPALELVEDVIDACRPHAEALGCATELERVRRLAHHSGAHRQLDAARGPERLQGLIRTLSERFLT